MGRRFPKPQKAAKIKLKALPGESKNALKNRTNDAQRAENQRVADFNKERAEAIKKAAQSGKNAGPPGYVDKPEEEAPWYDTRNRRGQHRG